MSVWVRHKVSILDLGALVALMAVATYIAFTVDIFANEPGVSEKTLTIELDEMMLLGVVLLLGLLVFALRRFWAQKREIARRMRAERRARELAYQDPLTGLPNRRQFGEALQVAIKSPPGAEAVHALLLLDLNGFKQVNDVYGHAEGDEVLITIAQRLLASLREGDLVARLGGDEFAVLAHHLMGPEAVAGVAQRIMAALAEPVVIGTTRHEIGAGIGIAILDGDNADESVRRADVALYRAKAERRSAFRFFEEEMDALVRERDALERDLRLALSTGAIVTAYRPTVDLRSGAVVGFEATPRWVTAAGETIPPQRFLAIAEECGLIHQLGEQTLRQGCLAALGWPPEVRLSVDLYLGQLADASLAPHILGILKAAQFDPGRLDIELSESALVQNLPSLKPTLDVLRSAGVRLTLDHFGTGYSTLYHLREVKLDRIKIDRSFVEGEDGDGQQRLLAALAGLGRGLGIEVSADGIDTAGGGIDALQSGVQQGQGEVFGRALNAEEAAAFAGAPPQLRRAV